MAFDMQAAIEEAREYNNNRLKVRVVHPSFGYVKSTERGSHTGAKTGAVFRIREA